MPEDRPVQGRRDLQHLERGEHRLRSESAQAGQRWPEDAFPIAREDQNAERGHEDGEPTLLEREPSHRVAPLGRPPAQPSCEEEKREQHEPQQRPRRRGPRQVLTASQRSAGVAQSSDSTQRASASSFCSVNRSA